MTKRRVIIVGGGLFGSIAAELCVRNGHDVTVFDSEEPYAASQAAGCLFKPSWAAGLPADQYERAVRLLDELYGVVDVPFMNTQTKLKFNLQHVNPRKILGGDFARLRVLEVGNGWVRTEHNKYKSDAVLVAAGALCRDLIPNMPEVKSLAGASIEYEGVLDVGRLKVWAPYKQMLAFNIAPQRIWFGDGGAIKAENYGDEYIRKSIARGAGFLRGFSLRTTRIGHRPYVDGFKHGYFNKVADKLFVSTGGAKNGTLLAALKAQQFIKEAGL